MIGNLPMQVAFKGVLILFQADNNLLKYVINIFGKY
jgi:hypothetical protein